MLNWSKLDPHRFERAVQMLLRARHPGLVSIDGAGGDGGRDAVLVTSDGTTVFEVKSFSKRLTASQRRNIRSSLVTALGSTPALRRWVLIVPLNPSPAELEWFTGKLREGLADIAMDWPGVDWLDLEAAQCSAFRRYLEGPESELLELASRFQMEQAALAGGGADLFRRNAHLKEQVDSISQHWTADWAVVGNVQQVTLRAKHPDAPLVDPIFFKPRFAFDPGDDEAAATHRRLTDAVNYGVGVEIPHRFVDLVLEASDEVKLLLNGIEGPGTLTLRRTEEKLERPIRASLDFRCADGSSVGLDVWFESRTAGAVGVELLAFDPGRTLRVQMRMDRPQSEDRTVGTGTLNLTFENPWHYAVADVLPALRFQAALQKGGTLTLRLPGLAFASVDFTAGEGGGDINWSSMVRIAEVVERLEAKLGRIFKLPSGVTMHELEFAEGAAMTFEEDSVRAPIQTVTASIQEGRVAAMLTQLPSDDAGLQMAQAEQVLQLGDVEIPFGPLAIWIPDAYLANREDLALVPEGASADAEFKSRAGVIFFRSREHALEWLGDPETADSEP